MARALGEGSMPQRKPKEIGSKLINSLIFDLIFMKVIFCKIVIVSAVTVWGWLAFVAEFLRFIKTDSLPLLIGPNHLMACGGCLPSPASWMALLLRLCNVILLMQLLCPCDS
jgi:hypothetical protein